MRQKAKQIQQARIIWTVVHLQPPYKDNKQKLSNKHTLQIRRSTRMQCISKSKKLYYYKGSVYIQYYIQH